MTTDSHEPLAPRRIAAVLLAAGASSRLGFSKLHVDWRGQTLLERSAQSFLDAPTDVALDVFVVVDPRDAESIQILNRLKVIRVDNVDAQCGMGRSLKVGVAAALRAHSYDAVIISVADQPYLTREHVRALIAASAESPERLIASRYGARIGVPAVFPASSFPALLGIADTHGARAVLDAHTNSVIAIDAPELAIDIDTGKDLRFIPGFKVSSSVKA